MSNTTHQTTEDIEAWLQGLKEENSLTTPPLSSEIFEETLLEKQESQAFQEIQQAYLKDYLSRSKKNHPSSLLVLNGLDLSTRDDTQEETRKNLSQYLLPEHFQNTAGGFYLRIQDKGFAINPGPFFLEGLHEQGFTIQDIDYVIATHDSQNFSEIKAIYDLNTKCNPLKNNVHLISYYLHPNVYKVLFNYLIPHFKQEKDCIHALEFYLDSNGLESVDLGNQLTFHYFSLSKRSTPLGCLGISIENHKTQQHVGWVSFKNQTEFRIPTQLPPFHILHLNLQDPSLEALPQEILSNEQGSQALLLCSFEGNKGEDTRFETIKSFKKAFPGAVILPADRGLQLQLADNTIQCSNCQRLEPSKNMRVIKTQKCFGRLHYLCSHCTL